MRLADLISVQFGLTAVALPLSVSAQSDAERRKAMIEAYPGSCACQYNLARNSSRWDPRSAYTSHAHTSLCNRRGATVRQRGSE